MTKNITTTQPKNIQDNTQQPQNPKLPIPNDKRQSEQPPLNTQYAVQRPLKAELGQSKQPKTKVTWGYRFFRWRSRFCKNLSRTLLTGVIICMLFEMVPSLKEELPKLYQVYRWVAEVAEKLFEFVYGFFGSLFRWELPEFFPQVWEGAKELFQSFIQLF